MFFAYSIRTRFSIPSYLSIAAGFFFKVGFNRINRVDQVIYPPLEDLSAEGKGPKADHPRKA
jgi:hypothetical protein